MEVKEDIFLNRRTHDLYKTSYLFTLSKDNKTVWHLCTIVDFTRKYEEGPQSTSKFPVKCPSPRGGVKIQFARADAEYWAPGKGRTSTWSSERFVRLRDRLRPGSTLKV